MSCQQASRVSEDPYAFTEPAPLQTTSLYHSNSQLSSLSSINKEQKQLPHISSSSQKSRVNGVVASTNTNGVIKNTIYHQPPQNKPQTATFASVYSKQFQSQQTVSKFSKKVLPHKSVSAPSTTSTASLLTTASSSSSSSPSSSSSSSSGQIKYIKQLPQQQLQNKTILVPENKKYLINHSNSLLLSSSSVSLSSSSTSLSSPTTTITTVLPTAPTSKVRVLQQNQQQQSQSKILFSAGSINNSINNKVIKYEPNTAIPSYQTALPTINTIKTPTAAAARRISNSKSVESQLPQHYSVIINTSNNPATAPTTTVPSGAGFGNQAQILKRNNSSILNNKNITFVIPKQENVNTGKAVNVAKKNTVGTGPTKATASAGKRTKRSYSRSSHHETVQRISVKTEASDAGKAKTKNPAVITIPMNREWHAPDSFIYDYTGPGAARPEHLETSSCTQNFWFMSASAAPASSVELKTGTSDNSVNNVSSNNSDSYFLINLTRDERLQMKRSNLRRKAVQYWNGQNLRNILMAKRRLSCVFKVLKKLQQQHDEILDCYTSNRGNISSKNQAEFQKCTIANCNQKALVLTAYCYQHITNNSDQRLFHPCTAKFSDNTQCRVPVFDISHELPLCQEHAWKRDNYNKMLQELKPKKPPRKKPKPSAMTRPPKRNKKKKKLQLQLQQQKLITTTPNIQQHQLQQPHEPLLPPPHYTTIYNNYHANNKHTGNNIVQINNSTNNHHHQHQRNEELMLTYNNHQQHHQLDNEIMTQATQDLLNICENSSAYASSEDTGVGGLSESELMASQDVMGNEEIPFEIENHELTNVLNQLPVELHELFGEQPSQEEQEDLERALEAVDVHQQLKSLEQMTEESTNFLGDFLDNVDDEMLDESDICSDQMLQSSNVSDIRGLVHMHTSVHT